MTLDAWLALYVIVGAVVGVWLSVKHSTPRQDKDEYRADAAIVILMSIAFWPFILLSFWLEAGDDSL